MAFEHPVTLADIPDQLYGKDIYSPSPDAMPRLHISDGILEWVDENGVVSNQLDAANAYVSQLTAGKFGTALTGDLDNNLQNLLQSGLRDYVQVTGAGTTTGSTEVMGDTTNTVGISANRFIEVEFDGYIQNPANQTIQMIMRYVTGSPIGSPTLPAPTTTSTILNSAIFPEATTTGIKRARFTGRLYNTAAGYYRFGVTIKNLSASPQTTFISPQGPGYITVKDIGYGANI